MALARLPVSRARLLALAGKTWKNQHSFAASSVAAPTSSSVPTSSSSASLPSLSNIEASWKSLAPGEQEGVFKHLEELQKKDWKELTVDQKKAAYYVSFGPHGPREPILPPGSNIKIVGGTLAAIAAAIGLFAAIRSQAPPQLKTQTEEWVQATRELQREQKMDPFTGASSDKKV